MMILISPIFTLYEVIYFEQERRREKKHRNQSPRELPEPEETLKPGKRSGQKAIRKMSLTQILKER
ncbi:hypothetical protein HRED_08376 [Candidatus Haloredivivus sp. G17]|nr:hypothetical protein HRED_08376 [Candidatus Haloredivivus sp. G17]